MQKGMLNTVKINRMKNKNNIIAGSLTTVTDVVEKKIIAYIIPVFIFEEEKICFGKGYINDVQLSALTANESVIGYTSILEGEFRTINLMRNFLAQDFWYVNINEYDWIHYESISRKNLPLHLGVHNTVDGWVAERLRNG